MIFSFDIVSCIWIHQFEFVGITQYVSVSIQFDFVVIIVLRAISLVANYFLVICKIAVDLVETYYIAVKTFTVLVLHEWNISHVIIYIVWSRLNGFDKCIDLSTI